MKALRTYHALRFVLAAVLVFGAALPLVEYACAMSGEHTSMSPALASTSESSAEARTSVSEQVLVKLCADMACCQETSTSTVPCEDPCTADNADSAACADCITETVLGEDAFVLTKVDLPSSLLPLVAFLTTRAEIALSTTPLLRPACEAAGSPGATPSLRVLHASFLL